MSTTTIETQQAILAQTTRTGSAWMMLVDAGRASVGRLMLALNVSAERRQMRSLSDEMLNDLGITRAQLNEECSRSIADIPANRS